MSETALMRAIRGAVNATGLAVVWRNNVGHAQTADGRHIVFGLGVGSPDLVGFLIPSGRFLGLEVKAGRGRSSHEQVAWHTAAARRGALVAVVSTIPDALEVIRAGTSATDMADPSRSVRMPEGERLPTGAGETPRRARSAARRTRRDL